LPNGLPWLRRRFAAGLIEGGVAQPLTEVDEKAAKSREAAVSQAASPLRTRGRDHPLDARRVLELGLPLLCEEQDEDGIL